MRARVSALLLLFAALFCLSRPVRAAEWQQPTPEELSMTSDPAAPNADAIYLYLEEKTDALAESRTTYVRLKILRDVARKYADVEIPTYTRECEIADVHGRTIHPDGTIFPLKGKPYRKTIVKTGYIQFRRTIFSLPNVETGSILEYSYKFRCVAGVSLVPRWTAQRREFIRNEHFSFHPVDATFLASSQYLPPGAKITFQHGRFELDLTNVPGIPEEEFEPPLDSISYRVRFYETRTPKPEDYWKQYGKNWSDAVDAYAASSPSIVAAANNWTIGAKTEQEKAEALYSAIMKLDNTEYSREHSAAENKAGGVKQIDTASDVLAVKRGNPSQLALLYLALVHATGLKAYAMKVADRDQAIFQPTYPSATQLDDTIVIVVVGGKEVFCDPGERYATFGHLHWRHSDVGGVRQQEGGSALAHTPLQKYTDNMDRHQADLALGTDGSVTGTATEILSGTRALQFRQMALETDEAALKRDWENEVKTELPLGPQLHADHFLGLDPQGESLVVRIAVSGSLGSSTGKRLFVPLSIFAAGRPNPFTSSHRETVIDMRYPFYERDEVVLHVPAGMVIETVSPNVRLELPNMAAYVTTVTHDGQTITFKRDFAMANAIYKPEEYDKLKGFLSDVSNKDREQAVLQIWTKASQ